MTNNRKWIIFFVCAIAVFMVDVDLTSVNLALVKIAADLRVSLLTIQWIIDGYMIAAAALMAFGGRLSDVMGYRHVFLLGLLAFGIASAGVAFSSNATEIIIARILQGACIAFTFPISLVVIRSAFPANQQGYVVGLMVAIAGLSQAIGPTFGGWILTYFNWRMIFLINIPLTLLSLVVGYVTIPKSLERGSWSKINFPLISLFCLGLLLLMYALNQVTYWGALSARFISCIIIAVIAITWFIRIENRSATPMLNLNLLKVANFRQTNIIRFILSFIYFTLLFTLGLLLQNILDYSALDAGYFLLLLTLVLGVLSIPAGKLVDIIGVKKPLLAGMVLLVLCSIVLAAFYFSQSITLLTISLFFLGISFALTVPTSASAAMMSVKPEQAGAAMGMFFTTSFIGGSFGIAISSLLLHYFSAEKLSFLLSKSNYSFNPKQMHLLLSSATGTTHVANNTVYFSAQLIKLLTPIIRSAFTYAFLWVMCLSLILAIIALFSTKRLRFGSDT